jgi:hypothetical protein
MFKFLFGRKDPQDIELEEKLDKDLLEGLIYRLKDEPFYLEQDKVKELAKVDLTFKIHPAPLVHIDSCYELLHQLQDSTEESLTSEYDPSKKAKKYILALRQLSLTTQFDLFSIESRKRRIQKIVGDMDSEVFALLTRFRLSVYSVLHEIFDVYDIRVYPKLKAAVTKGLKT